MCAFNKRDWKKIKKRLPFDWRVKVKESLENVGVASTLEQISDVQRGRQKRNPNRKLILKAIVEVSNLASDAFDEVIAKL